MTAPTLDAVLEEINRLKTAADLLEKLYSELGPYAHMEKEVKINPETWRQVQDFFGFDDSE